MNIVIQQINNIPAQPIEQAASNQQAQKDTNDKLAFRFILNASANKLEQNREAQSRTADINSSGKKDDDKQTSNAKVQTLPGLDLSQAAIVNGSLVVVIPQVAGNEQKLVSFADKVGTVSINSVASQNMGTIAAAGGNVVLMNSVPLTVQANALPVVTVNPAANVTTANPSVVNETIINQAAQDAMLTSRPALQQVVAESVQTNLQNSAQGTEMKANQQGFAQQTATTPVQSKAVLQAVQSESSGSLQQNLQEQSSGGQTQTMQAKQTAIPLAAKVANAADDKTPVNLIDTGYADMIHSGNVVIPVSDSSSSVQKSVSSQLTDSITSNLKNGKQEFQIDLYPKDLGKVSVKLASENGILTVEIMAANPKTQSLLLSGSNEIKSILQASTHQPVQVDASQNKQWYDQPQHHNSQSNAQQQEDKQQHNNNRTLFDKDDDSISTVDFLSVMRQLSVKV